MKFERLLEILNRLNKLYSLKECTADLEDKEIHIRKGENSVARIYSSGQCWVMWRLIEEKEYPESDNRFTETVREIDETEPSPETKPKDDDDIPFQGQIENIFQKEFQMTETKIKYYSIWKVVKKYGLDTVRFYESEEQFLKHRQKLLAKAYRFTSEGWKEIDNV